MTARRQVQQRRRFFGVAAIVLATAAVAGVAISTTSAATKATPDPNGSLIAGITADVGNSFDPRTQNTTGGRNVMTEIYNGLVEKRWQDPKNNRTLDIVPGLASSWTLSKNKLTYTFQLRKGVKFHDGTPFDAAAVEFYFKTLLTPSFEFYFARGNAASIRNLNEVQSFKATGPYTFQFTLKEPFAPFLDVLSNCTNCFIVSPTAIKTYGNDAITQHPTGTGAFKFVSYTPGQKVVFVRNDDYWRGKAAYKNLVLVILVDPVARANALESGQINVAEEISLKNKQAWAGRKDLKVAIRPRGRTYMCWNNLRGSGPTTNRDFREALNYATNRGAMNQILFSNLSNRAGGYFAPGTPGYNATLKAYDYNTSKAAALKTKSGLTGNVTLTAQVSPGVGSMDAWVVLADGLRKIGVTLNLKTVDAATWVGDFIRSMPATPAGPDMMCGAVGSDALWHFAFTHSTAGYPQSGGYDANLYSGAEKSFNEVKKARTAAGYIAGMQNAMRFVARSSNRFTSNFMVYDLNIYGMSDKVQYTTVSGAQQHSFYTAVVYK